MKPISWTLLEVNYYKNIYFFQTLHCDPKPKRRNIFASFFSNSLGFLYLKTREIEESSNKNKIVERNLKNTEMVNVSQEKEIPNNTKFRVNNVITLYSSDNE